MKQVLITKEQLNKIACEVNAGIISEFVSKKDDIFAGMVLTIHTEQVMRKVCDILFGKEESNAEKTDSKKISRPED